jgi:hypothetical protein
VLLSANWYNYYFITRFNEDGAYDLGFGYNGINSFSLNYFNLPGFTIQQEGKIVIAGKIDPGLAIVRFLNNGFVDQAYGNNGVAIFDSSIVGDGTSKHTISLQDDGKILVGTDSLLSFYIARVLNDVGTGIQSNGALYPTLQLFPNPASDQLIIEASFLRNRIYYSYDFKFHGQIVKQQQLNKIGDKLLIDVEDLSAGIYCITLKSSDSVITGKFVKQ